MFFKNEHGVITLEACITVTTFVLLMLFLSSVFTMFMIQNITAHATLQTSQSLSVDSLAGDEIGTGDTSSIKELVIGFVTKAFGHKSAGEGEFATNSAEWFGGGKVKKGQADADSALQGVVRKRFIAYLAGEEADSETKADSLLRTMNVEDGLDGVDFSESRIEDGNLHVVVKYLFKSDFKIWGTQPFEVRHETCSKLWSSE